MRLLEPDSLQAYSVPVELYSRAFPAALSTFDP